MCQRPFLYEPSFCCGLRDRDGGDSPVGRQILAEGNFHFRGRAFDVWHRYRRRGRGHPRRPGLSAGRPNDCVWARRRGCGNLSRRAIEMWTNIMTKGEKLRANSFNLGLVLSPCCLPHKVRVPKRKYNDFGYWIQSTQRQFGIDGYDLWATSLYNLVCSHVGHTMRSTQKRFFRDENLLSPTNWFILVTPMEAKRDDICQPCV